MNFNGLKVVITGGSSGIGAGLAHEIAKRGGDVLAVSRNINEKDFPEENITTAQFDLRNNEGVDALFDYASEKLKVIDLFIANAGYGIYGNTKKPDWDKVGDIFSLNVFSPIYSLQKMCELFPERPFNFAAVDSVGGRLPLPGFSLYCSTKFALDGFLRTFRYEMPANAFISVIYPVSTGTSFFKKSGKNVPVPGPVQPLDEAVAKIADGLEKGKKEIFPSNVYALLNICNHIMPPAVNAFLNGEKKRYDEWAVKHTTQKKGKKHSK